MVQAKEGRMCVLEWVSIDSITDIVGGVPVLVKKINAKYNTFKIDLFIMQHYEYWLDVHAKHRSTEN